MEIKISNKLKDMDRFLQERMKEWSVPGMAIAVVQGKEMIGLYELGVRDADQNLKVSKDTIFAIGSASKAFTSLAIGILVDEGELDWDTPIKKYIPDFQLQNKYVEEHLTLRDMLCHRSGLARHDMVWFNSSVSRKELVERMKHLEFNKDFRETCQYNNLMYGAVGYIIEKVTGMTWEEFVQRRIFEPLGMDHSNFSVEVSKKSPDYSLPYVQGSEGVHQVPFRNIDVAGPAGSINSNLIDMVKWLTLHLNKGKVNGKQVVSEKNLFQTHFPNIPFQYFPWNFDEIKFSSYGLGWFIDSYRGKKQISHAGSIDGFSSYVSFLPEEQIGIVILTNLDKCFLSIPITYSIYDQFLGCESVDWNDRVKNRLADMMRSIESANEVAKQAKNKAMKLIRPVEEYTGVFENPGYGKLKVEKQGEKLVLTHNNIEYALEHKCYDAFTTKMMVYYTIAVTFQHDSNGEIASVSIPFEPTVKDIVFKKCK